MPSEISLVLLSLLLQSGYEVLGPSVGETQCYLSLTRQK